MTQVGSQDRAGSGPSSGSGSGAGLGKARLGGGWTASTATAGSSGAVSGGMGGLPMSSIFVKRFGGGGTGGGTTGSSGAGSGADTTAFFTGSDWMSRPGMGRRNNGGVMSLINTSNQTAWMRAGRLL